MSHSRKYQNFQVEDLRIKLNRLKEQRERDGIEPPSDPVYNYLRDPARDHQSNRQHDYPQRRFYSATYRRGGRTAHQQDHERPSQGYSKEDAAYRREFNQGRVVNIKVEVKTDTGSRTCSLEDNHGYPDSRGRGAPRGRFHDHSDRRGRGRFNDNSENIRARGRGRGRGNYRGRLRARSRGWWRGRGADHHANNPYTNQVLNARDEEDWDDDDANKRGSCDNKVNEENWDDAEINRAQGKLHAAEVFNHEDAEYEEGCDYYDEEEDIEDVESVRKAAEKINSAKTDTKIRSNTNEAKKTNDKQRYAHVRHENKSENLVPQLKPSTKDTNSSKSESKARSTGRDQNVSEYKSDQLLENDAKNKFRSKTEQDRPRREKREKPMKEGHKFDKENMEKATEKTMQEDKVHNETSSEKSVKDVKIRNKTSGEKTVQEDQIQKKTSSEPAEKNQSETAVENKTQNGMSSETPEKTDKIQNKMAAVQENNITSEKSKEDKVVLDIESKTIENIVNSTPLNIKPGESKPEDETTSAGENELNEDTLGSEVKKNDDKPVIVSAEKKKVTIAE